MLHGQTTAQGTGPAAHSDAPEKAGRWSRLETSRTAGTEDTRPQRSDYENNWQVLGA